MKANGIAADLRMILFVCQGLAAAGIQVRGADAGVGVAMHTARFHADRGATWFLHAA